jgi:hypothetical protein
MGFAFCARNPARTSRTNTVRGFRDGRGRRSTERGLGPDPSRQMTGRDSRPPLVDGTELALDRVYT